MVQSTRRFSATISGLCIRKVFISSPMKIIKSVIAGVTVKEILLLRPKSLLSQFHQRVIFLILKRQILQSRVPSKLNVKTSKVRAKLPPPARLDKLVWELKSSIIALSWQAGNLTLRPTPKYGFSEIVTVMDGVWVAICTLEWVKMTLGLNLKLEHLMLVQNEIFHQNDF